MPHRRLLGVDESSPVALRDDSAVIGNTHLVICGSEKIIVGSRGQRRNLAFLGMAAWLATLPTCIATSNAIGLSPFRRGHETKAEFTAPSSEAYDSCLVSAELTESWVPLFQTGAPLRGEAKVEVQCWETNARSSFVLSYPSIRVEGSSIVEHGGGALEELLVAHLNSVNSMDVVVESLDLVNELTHIATYLRHPTKEPRADTELFGSEGFSSITSLGTPFWYYGVIITIWLLFGVALFVWLVRNEIQRLGKCIECGYDLRGSIDAQRCPECGETIPDEIISPNVA